MTIVVGGVLGGVGLLLVSVVGVTLVVRKCRQSKVVTECSDRDPASKLCIHLYN